MSKNSKKTKKNKDKVPPDGAKQCSGPIDNRMSNGKLEKCYEETSGTSKNKENITTPSEMLHTITDESKMDHSNTNEPKTGPEPPETNPEELSDLKNTCRALKANLNATSKKYEVEKKEKEKYYNENQCLKSKVSSLERELKAVKKKIEKLEKDKAHPRKSFEDHVRMEVDTPVDDSHEPPEQKASDEGTWEEKEHLLVQNYTQGTAEESGPVGKQDSEMMNVYDGAATGPAQGYDRDLNLQVAAGAPDTEAGSNSQHFSYRTALAASGSGKRWENWRSGEGGQKHQRPQHHPHNEGPQPQQHHGPRHFQNDNFRGRGRGRGNRGDHDQNFNRNMRDHTMRIADEPSVVIEVTGDLFEAPEDCSLAHCVAEDMRMGSGIAVTFRQKFKHVDELLDQRVRQGNVAVLEHEGRYIYYLVTKRESTGKPTMETLQRSLLAMCEHVKENQVKKIAMPRIGCGLDRLEWRRVKPLIERIFSGTCAQITVYNYNEDVTESSKPKPTSNVWLKTDCKPVADIAPMTAILCLCAADGSIDSTFGLLDKRFQIMTPFQKMDRKLGDILDIQKRGYCIFLLVVKETETSPLSFRALGECVREACKLIDKQRYYYVAVEAFDDKDDPLLFEKVVTVIKMYLDTKSEKELWICHPKTFSEKYSTRPNSGT